MRGLQEKLAVELIIEGRYLKAERGIYFENEKKGNMMEIMGKYVEWTNEEKKVRKGKEKETDAEFNKPKRQMKKYKER